jgi:hypothetical protein
MSFMNRTERKKTYIFDYLKSWCLYEQNGQIIFRDRFSNKDPIFTCRFASFPINAINFDGS